MGSLTRTMTRHCQMSIACSPWDSLFDLDRYCIPELEFWQSNLKIVNCRSFLPKSAANKTFFSDASQLSCAAHSGDGKLIAHRMFTELERAESSTFRELAAITFALRRISSSRTKLLAARCECLHLVKINCLAL